MTAPYQPPWRQPDGAGPGAAESGAAPGLPDGWAAGADETDATTGGELDTGAGGDDAAPDTSAAWVPVPGAFGSAEQRPVPGDPHTALARELAAAAGGLGDVDGLPVGEHVARYDAVHGTLQDALTSIDTV